MARLSRRTRIIAVIGALMLLGALGLGFTLLRPAEEESPWEFLGPADRDVTSLVFTRRRRPRCMQQPITAASTKVRMAARPGGISANPEK